MNPEFPRKAGISAGPLSTSTGPIQTRLSGFLDQKNGSGA
jgi:hypothetical protein